MNTIRNVCGRNYCFIGQLVYENRCDVPGEWQDVFDGVGVRLYQDLVTHEHFLCVEASESGEERWYQVEGAKLKPVAQEN